MKNVNLIAVTLQMNDKLSQQQENLTEGLRIQAFFLRRDAMSIQVINIDLGNHDRNLSIPASEVIITQPIPGIEAATFPTLVSMEKIIGRLHQAGYELTDPGQKVKIASLINMYYMQYPQKYWDTQVLNISTKPITSSALVLASDLGRFRNEILPTTSPSGLVTAHSTIYPAQVNQSVRNYAHSINSHSSDMQDKIIHLIVRTAIVAFIETVVPGLTHLCLPWLPHY